MTNCLRNSYLGCCALNKRCARKQELTREEASMENDDTPEQDKVIEPWNEATATPVHLCDDRRSHGRLRFNSTNVSAGKSILKHVP